MSYLYDAMKEALGGKSFSSGTISKNWSPNEIRAIILMRDFLLVADYLKYPKVIPFDTEELYRDLSNPNRRGNLNRLLEDRQLSCLEEIYVDEAFQQKFQNVIDLEEYVQGLYNSKSRLRYYGYVTGMNSAQLSAFYQDAFQQGKMDCTLAKDMGGFRYNDLGNDTWYKQYNLRDQFYEIDKPKGRLHTYFAKCQQKIGAELKAKETQVKELSEYAKILKMFAFDVTMRPRISLLMKYSKFLLSMEMPMLKTLGEALGKELREKVIYKGLTKKIFASAVTNDGAPATEEVQMVVSLYNGSGVFDDKEGDIVLGKEGIFGLGTRISKALTTALRTVRTNEDRAIWRLLSISMTTFPEYEFVKELQTLTNLPKNTVEISVESVNSLIDFVYSLSGLTEEEFKLNVKGGNE